MTSILIVTRWPVGGIRTFLKYVYGRISAEQYRFTFLVPQDAETASLQEDLAHLNVEWQFVEKNPSAIAFSLRVFQLLRSVKFDILHAHGFMSAVISVVPLAFLKTHSIVTSHDVLQDSQFIGLKGRLRKLILAWALGRFEVIHSVSHDAQQNVLDYLPGIPERKCTVILNGIDPAPFLLDEEIDHKAELGLSSSTIVVGFFGRFMGQKGFKYLLDAIELLNNTSSKEFHVVAYGSGGFLREEMAEVSRSGLESQVTFRDFTPQISSAMKGCDVIAIPSLWEACPLLPMEALVSGVPIAASKCIGLREVIADTPAIGCQPADARSLADALRAASRLARSDLTEFRQVAAKRFDASRTRSELVELYNKVASSSW